MKGITSISKHWTWLVFVSSVAFIAMLPPVLPVVSNYNIPPHHSHIAPVDDIMGPYCAARPGRVKCCPGRDDYCTVPIRGTQCYCDLFCNETALDCCPDFWSFCMGKDPPKPTISPIFACEKNNHYYTKGNTIKDNCNHCTCEQDPVYPQRTIWRCTQEICLIRPKIINAINSGNYGWRASNYSFLYGMTLNDGVKYRLGTMPPMLQVIRMNPVNIHMLGPLPAQFDSRVKWPRLVHPVRDQGNCGASWAFSTTAVASDRLSIESGGKIRDELSSQQLLSCNQNRGQEGCGGGHLDRAWWFLRKHGLVSEDCYPYKSGATDLAKICMLSKYADNVTCPSGIPFQKEKVYHSSPAYRIAKNEREIMEELSINGPVQATFKVKEDFFMYKSGVYQYTKIHPDNLPENAKTGYHSVRIIGWGTERTHFGRSQKYWLCANSWGPQWGENGYFKIVRGSNECQIESFIIGVWGKVPGDIELHRLLRENRRERLKPFRKPGRGRKRRKRHLRRKLMTRRYRKWLANAVV